MNDALGTLAADYWEWTLKTQPTLATYLGDRRYDALLPDVSAAGRAAQDSALAAFEARLASAGGDPVTASLLGMKLREQREELQHHFHQWVLESLAGPQVWLLELLNHQTLRHDDDLEALTARYRAFRPYMTAVVDNLREGVAAGRTIPVVACQRVLGQLDDLLHTPINDSPLHPRTRDVPHLSRTRVGACEQAIAEVVYPAFEALRTYLSDYPARTTPGLGALPGGEEAYAYRIRTHTTTSMTADAIHELGLSLVASLEDEMRTVAGTSDLLQFRQALCNDPQRFYSTREELLADYRSILARVEAMLPRWFGRLPKSPCELKAIEGFREKDCLAAFYYPPSEDFSRRGVFYVNTYRPEIRPRHNAAALTVHEAVPGHHLQIALAMEHDQLPAFRRHESFTAFVEGWALYTERLADEMGVYADPLSRFGMLTFQVWRAARLVVDTGLHARSWSRTKAIEYFERHVGLPHLEIENEIDRYIMWPGQALAYAVGMHEIQALRRSCQDRLGARFTVRTFHDEVLRHGALPLTVLRQVVEERLTADLAVPS